MARNIGTQNALTLATALAMAIVGGLGLLGYLTFTPELEFWFQMGLLAVAIVFAFLLGMQYVERGDRESSEVRRA